MGPQKNFFTPWKKIFGPPPLPKKKFCTPPKYFFGIPKKMVSVLLSALVERFSVFRMRDFFFYILFLSRCEKRGRKKFNIWVDLNSKKFKAPNHVEPNHLQCWSFINIYDINNYALLSNNQPSPANQQNICIYTNGPK